MRRTFIDEAILSAEKSNLNVANHGAVVVYRGKIVGRGYNKYCVENKNKVNRWSVHAEVDAINNALRKISPDDLRKSSLIVVRKLKEGTQILNKQTLTKSESLVCEEIGYSAPCKNCTNFILRNGLRACYYS
uniref:CMP/dCMP-type deaminase domain-containing protein n=1 Tax=viral metagenome TaxID=1070528 RepID=A0A6C0LD28_9ZZZZ